MIHDIAAAVTSGRCSPKAEHSIRECCYSAWDARNGKCVNPLPSSQGWLPGAAGPPNEPTDWGRPGATACLIFFLYQMPLNLKPLAAGVGCLCFLIFSPSL